jgi:hypothetical protein
LAARRAIGRGEERWSWGFGSVRTQKMGDVVATGPDDRDMPEGYGIHIARHDPERVLADVEAKRRIIGEHPHGDFGRPDSQYCEVCHDDDGNPAVTGQWCDTVRLLALPYADHPDYREEWKP